MLEPKSRLFHAIVVMGLGVTGCSSEPAPVVDASTDATAQDAKGDATTSPDSPFQTDGLTPNDGPPSDVTSDPDGCSHVCFGQNWPCSFPCYV